VAHLRLADVELPDGRHLEHRLFRTAASETGWRPMRLKPLAYVQPADGIMDAAHHLFVADGATKIGQPADAFESARIEWMPLAEAPALIAKREIVCASTMAALLYLLVAGTAVAAREIVQVSGHKLVI
jgi:hypothetical protein